MNNQDTPETDAAFEGIYQPPWRVGLANLAKILGFARKLERERNQALADAEKSKAYKRVLKTENDRLRRVIRETIMENLHLADGDVCTLNRLKDAIGFDLDSTRNANVEARRQ